jgi:ubiquinone/menaquinone biosynthesis C-methylase UbiE
MSVKQKDFYERRAYTLIKKERPLPKGQRLENWRIGYIKRIFEFLNIKRGDTFLDVGVGFTGYTVIEAARRRVRSVGVDISLQAMKNARKNAKMTLDSTSDLTDFCVCSATHLPFRDKVFSRVASIAVLEHVPNDKLAIHETSRVTRIGGKIFISVPNTYHRILPIFILHQIMGDKKAGHLRRYKAETLASEFGKNSFLLLDVTYHSHLIKVIQYLLHILLPCVREKESRIWWKLEELDLKSRKDPTGTKFSIVMKKFPQRAQANLR